VKQGFYHVNAEKGRLPKIFGMTASPVTKKGNDDACDPLIHVFVCSGVKTCSEAAGQLSGLEDVLQAEVILLHLIFSMA
jgi:hypothetical protein